MPSNGRFTQADLVRVWDPVYKVYLAKANGSGAGWNTMNLHLHDIGVGRVRGNGQDSFYRSLPRQRYWKSWWCARGACGNAATPGFSNHGLGDAVDSNQAHKVSRYGRPFGWGPCSDAPWESWHRKRCRAFRRPNPGYDPRYPVLSLGSGGLGQKRHVLRLQRALRYLGWNLKADGNFGGATRTAVIQFQRRSGWKRPSGVVGRGTWIALVHARNRKRKHGRW